MDSISIKIFKKSPERGICSSSVLFSRRGRSSSFLVQPPRSTTDMRVTLTRPSLLSGACLLISRVEGTGSFLSAFPTLMCHDSKQGSPLSQQPQFWKSRLESRPQVGESTVLRNVLCSIFCNTEKPEATEASNNNRTVT